MLFWFGERHTLKTALLEVISEVKIVRLLAISYPSRVLCMQARSHHWVHFCETTGNSSWIPAENTVSNSPEEGIAEVDDLVVKKKKEPTKKKKKEGEEKKKKVFLWLEKATFIFQIHLLSSKSVGRASM